METTRKHRLRREAYTEAWCISAQQHLKAEVVLINHGSETARFARGDRVAQLAIVPAPTIDWVEVDDLDETERGAGGFGSTGT